MDQGDVVALEQNLANVALWMGLKIISGNGSLIGQKYLDVDLVSLVKNKIHVLIEADDNALKSDVDNVVKPNLNS